MKTYADQIIQPLLSEKSSARETKFNEFAIVVDVKMTKTDIAKAVQELFKVKALSVRTINFRKKARRTKGGRLQEEVRLYKKALVRLPEGKRLELK